MQNGVDWIYLIQGGTCDRLCWDKDGLECAEFLEEMGTY